MSAPRPEEFRRRSVELARLRDVTGTLADGEQIPLCRLRYGRPARIWGFSIYRASHDDHQPAMLHTGTTAGSPEDALDTACGLYLNGPPLSLGM